MRLGAVRAVCRVLLLGALASAWAPVVAAPAAAAPPPKGDPVADAKHLLEDARNAANTAAARFTEAQSRYEQLSDQVAEIEQHIQRGEDRTAHLHEIVARRAIVAYKTQGADVQAVLGNDPGDGMRSSVLLDAANESDKEAVQEYAALADDLAAKREELSNQRKLQKEALDTFSTERRLLDEKVADAQKAQENLGEKVRAGGAAAPGFSAAAINAPVIDGLVCPVPGAAFSNDFGQPRTGHRHQGNDMFAPIGTANLAVVSGNITYGPGGSGGNGAYLGGENGVTYIYYHLSEYVGGPRHVNQGEVIGKVGQTGNARAPHTHFEIRPGGRTANPINPYTTLIKIC
jgi:murein DD-endopeptidase MepM/ murein hydrolase activator NlpD